MNNDQLINSLLQTGKSYMAQQRYQDAEAVFWQILGIEPGYAEALHHLGLIANQLKSYQVAIQFCAKAIESDPSKAQYYSNMAYALKKCGEFRQAEIMLRRGLEKDPDNLSINNQLGEVIGKQERPSEAIEWLQKGLAIKQKPKTYMHLGTAYMSMGDFDNAEGMLREAIAMDPKFTEAYHVLAWAGKDRITTVDIENMESLTEKNDLNLKSKIYLHYALGRSYDMKGQYEKAWTHFRNGAFLKKKEVGEFDRLAWGNFFQRLRKATDANRLKLGLGYSSSKPIFIIGLPRSGTTLLEQILSSHSQIFGAGEMVAIGRLVDHVSVWSGNELSYPECLASAPDDIFRKLGEEYINYIDEFTNGEPYVVNKMLNNHQWLYLVNLMLPDAKVIYCRRNRNDNAIALYQTHFAWRHEWTYDLDDIYFFMEEYENLLSHWKRTLTLPILEVNYEDVVDDTENQISKMLEFIGVPWEESCGKFHQSGRDVHTASLAQVRQPIYKTSMGKWDKYKDFIDV